MGEGKVDLGVEKARVLGELAAFQDVCLPAFLDHGGIKSVQEDRRPMGDGKVNRPLHLWRRAVDRLADTLAYPVTLLAREEYKDFLFSPPEPGYTVRDGRISWQVCVGFLCNREPYARALLGRMGLGEGAGGDPVESLHAQMPAVRDWLLGILEVNHPGMGDTLCLLLPLLAEGDRDVVKELIDPETWRNLVLEEEGISPGARLEKLRIADVRLPRYLNNALLHVFGSLANNHFPAILDLLGHPNLWGGYTDLFPHYVFATLFGKVEILRKMERGD